MFCSKCGTQLPEGAAFCYNCGSRVEIFAPTAPQPSEVPQQPNVTAVPTAPAVNPEPVAPVVPSVPVEPIVPTVQPESVIPVEPIVPVTPVVPRSEEPVVPIYTQYSAEQPIVQPIPVTPAPKQPQKKKGGLLWIIIIILVVLIAALVGGCIIGYNEGWFDDILGGGYQYSESKSTNSSSSSSSDNSSGNSSDNNSSGNNQSNTQSNSSSMTQSQNSNVQGGNGAMTSVFKSFIYTYEGGYSDTYFVVYSGDTIISINAYYGCTMESVNNGVYFSEEQQNEFRDTWTAYFEQNDFETPNSTTGVHTSNEEMYIEIKFANLQFSSGADYLQSTNWINGYTSGMTMTEFSELLDYQGFIEQ